MKCDLNPVTPEEAEDKYALHAREGELNRRLLLLASYDKRIKVERTIAHRTQKLHNSLY